MAAIKSSINAIQLFKLIFCDLVSSNYAVQLLKLTQLCLSQFQLCCTAAEVNSVVSYSVPIMPYSC